MQCVQAQKCGGASIVQMMMKQNSGAKVKLQARARSLNANPRSLDLPVSTDHMKYVCESVSLNNVLCVCIHESHCMHFIGKCVDLCLCDLCLYRQLPYFPRCTAETWFVLKGHHPLFM